MERIVSPVILAAFVLVVGCGQRTAPPAQAAPAASAVEGAWRVAEVATSGPTAYTLTDPPSVFIFTKTHYAMMRATGTQARPSFRAVTPSNDEKVAAYESFIANAGTYELAGSTLSTRPIVAKHPNFMSGLDTYEMKRDGDTLWLTGNIANLRYLFDGKLVSNPNPPAETRMRLVRIE
jgi:hypothetical protein